MNANAKPVKPIIEQLGTADYDTVLREMRAHNRAQSQSRTPDEFWIVEHPPVFTLGLAGKPEHVLDAGDIPLLKVDRGGQVTYHGPGQLVVYLLLDLKALGYGVKELVRRIEQSLIDLLAQYALTGYRLPGMPGVYVKVRGEDAKIAAIGLRVANHATYHGLSLNVDMQLAPFAQINPCGYEGLGVTQLCDLGVSDNVESVAKKLTQHLKENLYG